MIKVAKFGGSSLALILIVTMLLIQHQVKDIKKIQKSQTCLF